MKCLTKEEMEKMIEDAFNEGVTWSAVARAYGTYESESEYDKKEFCNMAKKEILKSIGEE